MLLKVLLTISLAIASIGCEPVRFDNYRVYEVSIDNADQLSVMQHLEQFSDGVVVHYVYLVWFADSDFSFKYSFWESPVQTGMTVNVMVPPHKIADFEELGSQMQISFKLKIENVQKYGR